MWQMFYKKGHHKEALVADDAKDSSPCSAYFIKNCIWLLHYWRENKVKAILCYIFFGQNLIFFSVSALKEENRLFFVMGGSMQGVFFQFKVFSI